MALTLIEVQLRSLTDEIERKSREAAEISSVISDLTSRRRIFEEKYRSLNEAAKLAARAQERKRLMEAEILAELEAPKRQRTEPEPKVLQTPSDLADTSSAQPTSFASAVPETTPAPSNPLLPLPLPAPLQELAPATAPKSAIVVKTPRQRPRKMAKQVPSSKPVDFKFPELPSYFNPAKRAAYVLHCSAAVLLSNELDDIQRIRILSDAAWLPGELKALLSESTLAPFRSAVVARVPGEMSRLLGVVWDPSLSFQDRIEAARQVSRPVARYVANQRLPPSQVIAMVCGALSAFMAHMARSTVESPTVGPSPHAATGLHPSPPVQGPKEEQTAAMQPMLEELVEMPDKPQPSPRPSSPVPETIQMTDFPVLPTALRPASLRVMVGGRPTIVPVCKKSLPERCGSWGQPVIRVLQPEGSPPLLDFSCIFHCDQKFENDRVLLRWSTPTGTNHQMQVCVRVGQLPRPTTPDKDAKVREIDEGL